MLRQVRSAGRKPRDSCCLPLPGFIEAPLRDRRALAVYLAGIAGHFPSRLPRQRISMQVAKNSVSKDPSVPRSAKPVQTWDRNSRIVDPNVSSKAVIPGGVAAHCNSITFTDCLQFLPHIHVESVNFNLIDPPYITRYKSRERHPVPNDDAAAWLRPVLPRCIADSGPPVIA
jgi:hypothetical protein